MKKAVFFDRDGVINESIYINGKSYPPNNEKTVRIMPGIHDVLAMLMKGSFLTIVVTNQPNISRGIQTKEQVDRINQYLFNELPIDKIYTCPHDDHDNCKCRKPKSGMLLQAQKEYDIDFSKSWMIGDRWSDMEAGKTVGCKTIFVDYGYKEIKPFTFDYKVMYVGDILEVIYDNKNLR
jgi:D-glycero-D-manno-heptose 1,7-bisphosphate phosphatase